MKLPALKPHFVLPPVVWLVLAVVSFIAAFSVWQNQRIERMRPPAAAASAPTAAPSTNGASAEPESAIAPGSDTPVPGLATVDGSSAPARQPDPQAGRQVLRCVSKGRVTYRDLNAGCPDGAAERVTVFPTEGVGKPR